MMTPEHAVALSIAVLGAGAVVTLLVSRAKALAGWLALLTTIGMGALLVPAVVSVLTNGPANLHHPEVIFSLAGMDMRFYVDGLSAFFLGLTVLVAVPAMLYSIGYLNRYEKPGSGYYYPCFLLFIASMLGLVTTTDMMWFFFGFWELMAVSGFLLARYDGTPQCKSASIRYVVWMQIGLAAAMIGTSVLAGAGGHGGEASLKYDFDVLAESLPAALAAKPGAVAAALALFLVGFGLKCGMWPFGQQWTPEAYTAVPSPVSAVLSGVLSKSGVYGLMRTFLWLIPAEAQSHVNLAKWGWIIAILGTITLFVGSMQALWQDSSKRLLAFSSLGQIGYIILGIGVCLAMIPTGNPDLMAVGTLAFYGALLHSLNHGVFKALLFLNQGSTECATGTQDLNKMGGLMKFMPLTALTAVVASLSIAGAPLFNGFVSKWGIYVSAIEGTGSARYLGVCAVIALLTSAITLAMYIKWFGVSFLSRTSAVVAARAKEKGKLEVSGLMQLPQLILAAVCVGMGLIPVLSYQLAAQVLKTSPQGLAETLATASPVTGDALTGLANVTSTALYVPLAVLGLIAIVFLVVIVVSKMGGSTRRVAAPWLCGYVKEADCYRYTAKGFYGEVTRHFRWLGGNAGKE
jgi:formate hydrogenlyase subunit 3/multisubunit Na+/H+ antiporter MnhD subunit